MANTIAPGGTHLRQERYANAIVKLLRKDLVTNEHDIFSTDYEGDPKAGAVKVPVRATEVSVRDYNIGVGLALDFSATVYLDIPISNHKAVNELIDKYEAAAVPDNLLNQRLESAAYSIGLDMDTDAIATLETEGTVDGNTTPATDTTAYTLIVDANTSLDILDVPREPRYLIVSPAYLALLKKDQRFVSAASDRGFEEVVKKGFVGEVDGVRVYMSNNMAVDTEFILGNKMWSQRIKEWEIKPTIRDLTNEFVGSSSLSARHIYQHTVTDANAVLIKTFV